MLPRLQVGQCLRQFGLQCGDKLAAGGSGGVGGALAADEDDAGSESVGADPIMRAQFRPHRPSAS